MKLSEAVEFIYKELDEAYCYNCRGGSEYDEYKDRSAIRQIAHWTKQNLLCTMNVQRRICR